jgi:hypothetical protein
MAGLVPAISLREALPCVPYRDRRDKPGDDDGGSLTDDPALPDFKPQMYCTQILPSGKVRKIVLARAIALCAGIHKKIASFERPNERCEY